MIVGMDRPSRFALPLAAGLLGFLAVLAAAEPRTAPGRETRRLELADLIVLQDARVREHREEIQGLEARLEEIRATGDQGGVGGLLAQAERLARLSGGAALEGPGVTVTLEDSSASNSPTGDPNDLVIHEQDIQTVVNALWAAGAEALSVNGERLTGTSAVRCAGNTLLLHGEVHSPPYEIRAIGDPEALSATLPGQAGMGRLLEDVRAFGLGLEIEPGPVAIPERSTAELAVAVPAA